MTWWLIIAQCLIRVFEPLLLSWLQDLLKRASEDLTSDPAYGVGSVRPEGATIQDEALIVLQRAYSLLPWWRFGRRAAVKTLIAQMVKDNSVRAALTEAFVDAHRGTMDH